MASKCCDSFNVNNSGKWIQLAAYCMFSWAPQIFAICFAYLLHSIAKWYYLRKSMPPGPLGVPLIGNQHQIPLVKPWLRFTEWSREHGPVISFFLGSTSVIVLGTIQAAYDLLDKRSEYYSSRPRSIIVGEILSDGKRGLLRSNDQKWRQWRKILHTGFHKQMAQTYRNVQSLESIVTMREIRDDPRNYERHLSRFAASVITSVVYGRRVDSMDEWVVKENLAAVDFVVNIPGKNLVESWPWLLRLPRKLQWFRKAAEERRRRDVEFLTYLYEDVKKRMTNGTVGECLAAQTIINQNQTGMTELELAYAISSPFGAGIETTAGTLTLFILAMLNFPEVMKRAQAEVDRIVGFDRVPEFQDKESLPYVNAVISETLRWRPIAVLGAAPHAVTIDDEYQGMFIPKGSAVYANIFAMTHDPNVFPSPELFRPERFLETSDPHLTAFDVPFGFGRRICPGMHLARNSLFINITRLLWAFDILPALSKDGRELIPDPWNLTNGFTAKPVSFECRIVPRNDKVRVRIEEEYQAAMEGLGV